MWRPVLFLYSGQDYNHLSSPPWYPWYHHYSQTLLYTWQTSPWQEDIWQLCLCYHKCTVWEDQMVGRATLLTLFCYWGFPYTGVDTTLQPPFTCKTCTTTSYTTHGWGLHIALCFFVFYQWIVIREWVYELKVMLLCWLFFSERLKCSPVGQALYLKFTPDEPALHL